MTRQEYKACLKALDRSSAWFLRQAGANVNAASEWFAKDGPGIPEELAAWLRDAAAEAEARKRDNPVPPPEVWSRVTWRRLGRG